MILFLAMRKICFENTYDLYVLLHGLSWGTWCMESLLSNVYGIPFIIFKLYRFAWSLNCLNTCVCFFCFHFVRDFIIISPCDYFIFIFCHFFKRFYQRRLMNMLESIMPPAKMQHPAVAWPSLQISAPSMRYDRKIRPINLNIFYALWDKMTNNWLGLGDIV